MAERASLAVHPAVVEKIVVDVVLGEMLPTDDGRCHRCLASSTSALEVKNDLGEHIAQRLRVAFGHFS